MLGRCGVALPVPITRVSWFTNGKIQMRKHTKEKRETWVNHTVYEAMEVLLSIHEQKASSTYSSENQNIFKVILMGMTAKSSWNQRINLITHEKRLISFECLTISVVGKTFVQNVSSLPNETWRLTLQNHESKPNT